MTNTIYPTIYYLILWPLKWLNNFSIFWDCFGLVAAIANWVRNSFIWVSTILIKCFFWSGLSLLLRIWTNLSTIKAYESSLYISTGWCYPFKVKTIFIMPLGYFFLLVWSISFNGVLFGGLSFLTVYSSLFSILRSNFFRES